MTRIEPGRALRLAVPILVVLLSLSAVWLFWDASERRSAERAGNEAVLAALDSIVAILSYQPGTAERDLEATAQDRLTGQFLDDYTQLIRTVVVPNAIREDVTAAARVPAAAVVSAEPGRVVVLAYVDLTTAAGKAAPIETNSSVRVSMERVDGRWLIAGFEPI